MRRRPLSALLLLILGAALACSAELSVELAEDAPSSGTETPPVTELPTPEGTPPEVFTFRSWDVLTGPNLTLQAAVLATSGNPAARLELSYLDGAASILLDRYAAGAPNTEQDVQAFWRRASDASSPYQPCVGRNQVPRGASEPPPAGAVDLQLRPSANLSAVASLVVPVTGRYWLRDLRMRRFRDSCNQNDNGTDLAVHVGAGAPVAALTVDDTEGDWHPAVGSLTPLGLLPSNERIHFVVASKGNDSCDDTEISWLVVGTRGP